MATLKTTDVKHVREDLGNYISMISPEKTPFKTEIGKSKATSTWHEFLTDELAPANAANARLEGADANEADNRGPARIGNRTQIFAKEVTIANTLQAVDTAGARNEKARQITKAGAELNRDIEAALVSANPSASTPGMLGGAEAWIKTNALHGTGGSTAGFANNNVGAVTDGDEQELTVELLNKLFGQIWEAGGNAAQVIAPGKVKQTISALAGGVGVWQTPAEKKTIYAGVDYYVSDFGVHEIIPHHFMTKTTLIAFDKDLWNVATLRGITKNELAKTGDSDKVQIITELTLECLNEAGNGKIADIKVN
ncbi:SU10 major capsid protein [Brucella rhizosphaerae]|uniref:Head protein n=1 Tax=Brucella rhizosphaerae TaxID=571254 RepID=A0A256F8G9_9HYPH|nr:DUF5309 family protein [Brucella rhizosphaerae]OYR11177.1 hypothetical protein CEV32_1475 [Brucella rhizosphaerae]